MFRVSVRILGLHGSWGVHGFREEDLVVGIFGIGNFVLEIWDLEFRDLFTIYSFYVRFLKWAKALRDMSSSIVVG